MSADDTLVVPEQAEIRVYRNNDGEIVIRQKGPFGEEDACIILHSWAAEAVARALIKEAEGMQ